MPSEWRPHPLVYRPLVPLCGPHIGSQQVCSVRRGKASGKRTRRRCLLPFRARASSSPCVADFILFASSPWLEYSVILRECLQAEVVSSNHKKFHETLGRAIYPSYVDCRLTITALLPLPSSPASRPSPCTRRRRQDARARGLDPETTPMEE